MCIPACLLLGAFLARDAFARTNHRVIAIMFVHMFVWDGHALWSYSAINADLSLWLDSPMFSIGHSIRSMNYQMWNSVVRFTYLNYWCIGQIWGTCPNATVPQLLTHTPFTRVSAFVCLEVCLTYRTLICCTLYMPKLLHSSRSLFMSWKRVFVPLDHYITSYSYTAINDLEHRLHSRILLYLSPLTLQLLCVRVVCSCYSCMQWSWPAL